MAAVDTGLRRYDKGHADAVFPSDAAFSAATRRSDRSVGGPSPHTLNSKRVSRPDVPAAFPARKRSR